MYERILVPLDGSTRSELILAQVLPLLKQKETEIIVMRAFFVAPSLARIDTGKMAKEDRDQGETYLHHVVRSLEEKSVRVRAILREEEPSEAILRTAADERVSLIAMTTHGRSGIARWFMGSVAEKVLRTSNVPLLLIHSFERSPEGETVPLAGEPISFRSILVPVDGSEFSMAVLPVVGRLARVYRSEVVILHVDAGPLERIPLSYTMPGDTVMLPSLPSPAHSPGEIVKRAADRLGSVGTEIRTIMAQGDPAAKILDISESEGIDLVAMTTHGRSGISRWVLGNVAEKVLRSTPVPMLVVRNR